MLEHFSVDIICLKKVLFRYVKITNAGGVQFANSATCFDVSSGFHGDTVSSKGRDGFYVELLELTIFNKADICLFFSSSSPFNIAI